MKNIKKISKIFLRKIGELFGFVHTWHNMVPVHQIIKYSSIDKSCLDKNKFISQGDDPHFRFKSPFKKGWYMLEIQMDFDVGIANTRFYVDSGNGEAEESSLAVPLVSRRMTKRLIYFSGNSKLRFDPLTHSGVFTINHLQIVRLPKKMALSRLNLKLEKYVGENNWASIEDSLQEKIKAYNNIFESMRDNDLSYAQWIKDVEIKKIIPLSKQKEIMEAWVNNPLISIIIPVYNAPENYLKACIDSVRKQSYPFWELCIADDASPNTEIKKILEFYSSQDSRIKVVFRKKNGHISAASNSALELASGNYVALLDHDDLLTEHALFYVVKTIHENPGAEILYSDEDKINENDVRSEPHFKSAWNPDLFFSQNYVSHLGIYKHEIIKKINGFRLGVEGSQDQDLLLRCLPHIDEKNIIHIPYILYHWRTLKGSTALASGEKNYTTRAGVKALKDYFEENGPEGVEVEAASIPNTYRVYWPLPSLQPLVSLLIPTRDQKKLTELAVRSILNKTEYSNYEIIIVDNGSVEKDALEFFENIQKETSKVRVLRYNQPFNFSAINNFGFKHARGNIFGLVNNDVEVISPDWLTEMVRHAIRPDIGCVGAKLYYGNNTVQHAGVILGIGGVANHSHKHFPKSSSGYFARLMTVQNYSAVTAACLLVKKEIYEKVGGLNEEHLPVAFNDVDFCLKVKKLGYRNLWTPYAELYHHESVSRGAEDNPEKIARFNSEVSFMMDKWGAELKSDNFYNENLTKVREDFSLAI